MYSASELHGIVFKFTKHTLSYSHTISISTVYKFLIRLDLTPPPSLPSLCLSDDVYRVEIRPIQI